MQPHTLSECLIQQVHDSTDDDPRALTGLDVLEEQRILRGVAMGCPGFDHREDFGCARDILVRGRSAPPSILPISCVTEWSPIPPRGSS